MRYVELAPNNGVRVEISLADVDENGRVVPLRDLAATVFVALTGTATAAIASLSYAMTEYPISEDGRTDRRGTYTAVIEGAAITTAIADGDLVTDQVVAINVIVGTTLMGTLPAIVRAVRSLL